LGTFGKITLDKKISRYCLFKVVAYTVLVLYLNKRLNNAQNKQQSEKKMVDIKNLCDGEPSLMFCIIDVSA
jgi:hypothetical protein